MANGADDLGGDGSDDDLHEIALGAAAEALSNLYDTCTNAGMEALADMIADAIMEQAEGMSEGSEPDEEALSQAIAGVHSPETAESCMSDGIESAFEALMDGWDEIVAHEAEEGVSSF